ncbi:MAG TPA: hypothetical protein VGF99_20625 [Myxococcota bacterium]
MHRLPHVFALAVSTVALVACGNDLDQCDPFDVPVADPGIDQGVAGVGASVADVCDGIIPQCACQPGDHEIAFYAVDAAPADDDDARAAVEAGDPITVHTGDDGYAQPLDAGLWLACSAEGSFEICSLITVDVDTVTTMHIVSSIDLPRPVFFAPDGEPLEPRRYDVTPPPSVCTGLDEDACTADSGCIGSYATPAENYCAGDLSVSVFIGCFVRDDELSCAEPTICLETDVGRVYKGNTCYVVGVACEDDACPVDEDA